MTQPATLLITNAKVYTVDEAQPWAEAVAVRANRIIFVGDRGGADAFRGPHTRVIDGAGRTLIPGIIDSHYHLLWGSLGLTAIRLGQAYTPEAVAENILAFAAAHPDREWLVGRGFLYTVQPDGKPLDRHFLDKLVPDRPLYIVAFDGHTAWGNTEALRRGNLLHGGETGPNSEIVMDPETGLATGELREPPAFKGIRDLLPIPTTADKRAALHKGMAEAASLGVTSVHNMDGDEEQIQLYAAMEDMGEMTLRVYVPYSVTPETPIEALAEAVDWRSRYQSNYVRSSCIKLFMDGVVESYTALLVDDYAGMPGNKGSANFSAEHFNRITLEADRLGLQVTVHAVGDGAVRRTLDGFALAQEINGVRDSRHRVEHIELLHPDDLPRFAELGVIASMQPLHSPLEVDETDVWPSRLTQDSWGRSFPWRALRDAGARLAFGSDWPVVSQDPMLGIHAALNRRPWLPGQPDESQTLEETIAGYTKDAAYTEFQEHEKGIIRTGYLADLVLLSANLFTAPVETIHEVRPVLTVCDGRVVFEANAG